MSSLLLEQIKKQTATFLNEKYKFARMTFSDVTEVELLAEEATNKDPCGPDAKTMTRIAEASFEVDEYWRIVDILHRRLYNIDWVEWRQSYKALVLLEFMLTHGPEEFAQEFLCDAEIIEELGMFTHIDERGFNWGARMQKVSDEILKLLQGGKTLREARLKALRITNEIHGFGSSMNSPTNSSSPCSSSSSELASPGTASFCSFSTTGTPTPAASAFFDFNELITKHENESYTKEIIINKSYSQEEEAIGDGNINIPVDKNHLWDGPAGEDRDFLIDSSDEENDESEKIEKPKGFMSGICSKLTGSSTGAVGGASREKIQFRCLSDVGSKGTKKKYDRQYSFWY